MNDWLTIAEQCTDLANKFAGNFNRDTYWFEDVVEDPPCSHNKVNMPAVRQAIFNKNATIVYFDDGTKCVVRKSTQDTYNREHAIVYAIVKRAYGTVDENGVVQGNGMGNMLAKIVASGYDQEAHVAAEKAKKAAKRKARFVGDDDHEKHGWGNEIVKPWKYENRDKYGRFVKKANRK